MILTLLAALNGAAQQGFVVYVGAESSHFVEDHPGSEYSWKVLVDFSPDTEANPTDFTFTSATNQHNVSVRWNKVGLYYLDVVETDITGCTNRKVLAVNVVPNNRSIAFVNFESTACYNANPSGFRLPIRVLDDGGIELDASYFPVDVDVDIGGELITYRITYDNQGITIPDSLIIANPESETQTEIRITEARDVNGQTIDPLTGSDVHTRTISAIPQLEFVYIEDFEYQYEIGMYEVGLTTGRTDNAIYHWQVDPSNGTSTDLNSITSETAQILWDGPVGFYTVEVWATDGNGCIADTISTLVEVSKPDPAPIPVYAGPDTIIGICEPYQFNQIYPNDDNYSYLWEPAQYLSDPTIANPVFTPGETTTYRFTATTLLGYSYSDTVTITVSEVQADAGEDMLMEAGTTVMLDGSGSSGMELTYLWTTSEGVIQSGASTAFPQISKPAMYYLEVTDAFGCTSIDSVEVGKIDITPADFANDDYDTTRFQTAVSVDVLANDDNSDGNIDPATLSIVQYPVNGSVYINFDDYSVSYTPNNGYTGSDVFEYRICKTTEKCDNAHVYVLVTPSNFFIPEAFTPNGDNINDFFEIKGIEYYPNNSIKIVNRWGKKVYEANRYGIETTPQFWDGKANQGGGNGDLPTGTYFYVLDLGNGEKPIAGSVYIDR